MSGRAAPRLPEGPRPVTIRKGTIVVKENNSEEPSAMGPSRRVSIANS